VTFEVLTAVLAMIQVFWCVTPRQMSVPDILEGRCALISRAKQFKVSSRREQERSVRSLEN
jgi:hypothetical protein